MRMALVVATAVVAGSCGQTAEVYLGCGPETCQGCCDGAGACVGVPTAANCGGNGRRCVTCTGAQQCSSAGACGDLGSAGGGAGGGAGTGGGTAGGNVTPCTAQTCASGCCVGTQCVLPAAQSQAECGTGGFTCTSCSSGFSCISGSCTTSGAGGGAGTAGGSGSGGGSGTGCTALTTTFSSDEQAGYTGASASLPAHADDVKFSGASTSTHRELVMELWFPSGGVSLPMTKDLSLDPNSDTCEICAFYAASCVSPLMCSQVYFGVAGTAAITHATRSTSTGSFDATLSNARFVEWDVMANAPVPGGSCFTLGSATFAGSW